MCRALGCMASGEKSSFLVVEPIIFPQPLFLSGLRYLGSAQGTWPRLRSQQGKSSRNLRAKSLNPTLENPEGEKQAHPRLCGEQSRGFCRTGIGLHSWGLAGGKVRGDP